MALHGNIAYVALDGAAASPSSHQGGHGIEEMPYDLRDHVFQQFSITVVERGGETRVITCRETSVYDGCAAWLELAGVKDREYIAAYRDVDITDGWVQFSFDTRVDDFEPYPRIRLKFK